MQAGKAVYYILTNNENVTNVVGTRVYPEIVAQDALAPFIYFEMRGIDPDSYKQGPAEIDEVRIEVSAVCETYDEVTDLGEKIRGALDRISGTFNAVNVESVEFNDATIDVVSKPRRYVATLDFTFRILRGDFTLATGSPITGYQLGQLSDVTLDEPLDRQGLVYDEATSAWINGGVGSLVIPVRNPAPTAIPIGTIVKAIGSQGDRILVSSYSAGDEPELLVGVTSEAIAAGGDGHVQSYGELRQLDTSSYTIGTILYPGSGGTFSTTQDVNDIALAIVTRVHENTGRVFVRSWTPGASSGGGGATTLGALTDVTITSPGNGHTLQYNDVSRVWENVPQTTPTPPPDTTDDLPEGTTNLYFTDARAQAAVTSSTIVRSVNGEVGDQEGDVSLDTTAVPEGTNLYHTTARVNAVIGASSVTALTDVTSAGSGAIITTAERSKLAGIAAGAEVNVNADWTAATGDAAILNKPTIPTELGDLGGNADEIADGQTNKFFTDAERTKLSGIATGAEVNVNADWDAVSGDAQILNKPSIPSAIGDLSDVPASLGTAGQVLAVNAGATALEYVQGRPQAGVAYFNQSTTQVITATATLIDIQGTYYDEAGIFDTTNNNITLSPGYYMLTADVSIIGPTTRSGSRSEVEVRMLVNGNPPGGFSRRIYARDANGGSGGSCSFSFPYLVSVGSVVVSWDIRRVEGGTTGTEVYSCQFSYLKLWTL